MKRNIDDEILEYKKIINFNNHMLEDLSKRIPDTDIDKENVLNSIKFDIMELERKLKILEEKKIGTYVPKKPECGDMRYIKLGHKDALDILRVSYYDCFGKDPSISFVGGNDFVMFNDDTLPLYVDTYLIRGEIPFKIMFRSHSNEAYKDYRPNEKYSVGVRFEISKFSENNFEKYLRLMLALIKRYTNNDVNFICGSDKDYTLAYINEKDFGYYEFFELLCDNIWRNIIYIGDTMQQNVSEEMIQKVYNDFVMFHISRMAWNLGVPEEEFIKTNNDVKNYVLKISENL